MFLPSAVALTGLKSFRFSSLGKAARIGDAAEQPRQLDDAADERHEMPASAAGRVQRIATEQPTAAAAAPPLASNVDVDSDSGRKRKAEGQGVFSPAPAGSQPATATALLVKRRASPELPAGEANAGEARPVSGVEPQRQAANGTSGDASDGRERLSAAINAGSPVQRPSCSGTAAAVTAGHRDGASCPADKSAFAAQQLSVDAEHGEDDDDDEDTVMPGNSRLMARVLAGRQSLAPPRAQVGHTSLLL